MMSVLCSWTSCRAACVVVCLLDRRVDVLFPRLLDLLRVVFFDREVLFRREEPEFFLFATEQPP